MVAYSRSAKGRRPSAQDDGALDPFEAATYIYLLTRELAPMAANAGLADVARRLTEAGDLTAQALEHLGRLKG